MARTAEAIARSRAIVQRAALTREMIGRERAERHLHAANLGSGSPGQGWVPDIAPLPLGPAMLMEISAEFHTLADQANSPESRTAYHDLAFRYKAMAAGYDTGAIRSRMFH